MEVNFSLDNIKNAANELLQYAGNKLVFAFKGDMGAGKTTFIHALCEVLGVKSNISSPTYSIINEYTTATGRRIFHMDLYRLKDEEEAIAAGVEDHLYSGDICFVEWPERAPGLFPEKTIYVNIAAIDNSNRRLHTTVD